MAASFFSGDLSVKEPDDDSPPASSSIVCREGVDDKEGFGGLVSSCFEFFNRRLDLLRDGCDPDSFLVTATTGCPCSCAGGGAVAALVVPPRRRRFLRVRELIEESESSSPTSVLEGLLGLVVSFACVEFVGILLLWIGTGSVTLLMRGVFSLEKIGSLFCRLDTVSCPLCADSCCSSCKGLSVRKPKPPSSNVGTRLRLLAALMLLLPCDEDKDGALDARSACSLFSTSFPKGFRFVMLLIKR